LQPHSFSKRQLAAIALMLNGGGKDAALSDENRRLWVHKCFQKQKIRRRMLDCVQRIADDEIKFYQYF
jgi:hypothetical protein